MSKLILPTRFNSQPQYPPRIARGELSQGLQLVYTPITPYNIVGNGAPTLGSAVSSVVTGLNGFEEDFTTNTLRRFAVPNNPDGQGLTLFVLAYSTNLSTDSTAMEGATSTGTPVAAIQFGGTFVVSRPVAVLANGAYPGTRVSVASKTYTANQWLSLAAVGTDSNGISLWYNGFNVASGSRAARKTISFISIGNLYAGTQNLAGGIVFGAYWNRALSAREVYAVSTNPWQIFQPAPRRLLVSVAAGSTGAVVESLSSSDAISATAIFNIGLSESISASDAINASALYGTVLAENLSPSDTVGGSLVSSAAVSETLTTSDAITASSVLFGVITETLSSSDAIDSTLITLASNTETLSASDTVTSAGIFSAALSDTLSPSDTIDGPAIYNTSLQETLTSSDTVSTGTVLAATLAETLSVSDSVPALWVTSGSLAETLSSTDTIATGGTTYNDSILEAGALIDSLGTAGIYAASLSDSLSSADSLSAINVNEIFPTIAFGSDRNFLAGKARSIGVDASVQRGVSR